MFEKHHLIHYDLNRITCDNSKQILQPDLQDATALLPDYDFDTEQINRVFETADFDLSGFADVLPFYPQTKEEQKKYLYIQSFSYMESKKNYFTKRSDYHSFLLCYTHDGEGELVYQEQLYKLHEGDLFIIDCTKKHSYHTKGIHWAHSDLHISGDYLSVLYEEFLNENHGLCIKENIGQIYLSNLEELLEAARHQGKHRGLLISHQIEKLFISLITAEEIQNPPFAMEMEQIVSYLVQYIQHHYQENLTLDYLADFSGISKYHLSRLFHQYTGFSPNEYIIQTRLDHARFLLINTKLSIKQIGAMVGIENEAYFSRLFKKRHDITPGSYRKKNAK
ncbi:MAG: helix-turn-helix domain-containing protein [Lachnospiraceae bacterium]|nr:helix-turn-helix domain-containing protein [Lachnospiraceae bacterium]